MATPGTSERARRFARWSAIGSLSLGMLGQVAYHLLTAVHVASAPWPLTMFVSCLPVVALALGTLAHLLRESAEDVPSAGDATGTVAALVFTAPATVPETVVAAVPVDVLRAVPASTVPPVPVKRVRTVASARAAKRASARKAMTPERVFAAEIEAGELPSLRAIKERMHFGTDRARVIRDQLVVISQETSEEA